MEEFAKRLQMLREKQHKSRRVVSELCGLPSDALRRYERCEAEPTMKSLGKLADYFEVSVDYLMGREEQSFYAVPVVRCKYCKYWVFGVCELHKVKMFADDFCSYGERLFSDLYSNMTAKERKKF